MPPVELPTLPGLAAPTPAAPPNTVRAQMVRHAGLVS